MNLKKKIFLKKFIIIFFFILLYIQLIYINNNQYFMEYRSIYSYQTLILPEIISFENNINITLEEMNEFRKINNQNELVEEKYLTKYSHPDVSIIITMYNQAHCIYKGIRSIQNQSIKNIEIIIIDDCSQDNGTEVIKEFQKNDPRIILISHEKNEGEMKSRVDGIRKAKGKYITIIDGDDAFIHRNILKNSLSIAQKGKIDVVEFNAIHYSNGKFGKKIYNYSTKKNFTNVIIYQPELRDKFINKKYFYSENRVIWGKLIKQGLFKNVLLYLGKEITDDYINEAEDTIMAIGLFHLANSYYIMREPGYVYTSGEKKNRFPLLNNKVCKINNKIKGFGWYKYYKFLVDKCSINDLEKNNIIVEMKFPDGRKKLDMKLDNEYYQILFYIYDTMLNWKYYNQEQRNYILELKNKTITKRNGDNINYKT